MKRIAINIKSRKDVLKYRIGSECDRTWPYICCLLLLCLQFDDVFCMQSLSVKALVISGCRDCSHYKSLNGCLCDECMKCVDIIDLPWGQAEVWVCVGACAVHFSILSRNEGVVVILLPLHLAVVVTWNHSHMINTWFCFALFFTIRLILLTKHHILLVKRYCCFGKCHCSVCFYSKLKGETEALGQYAEIIYNHIHLPATLKKNKKLGTPVHLLIHAIIQ